MPYALIKVRGSTCPLPGDLQPFEFEVKGKCVETAWLALRNRLLPHLRNRVPFVVEDHQLIAAFTCEVHVCD